MRKKLTVIILAAALACSVASAKPSRPVPQRTPRPAVADLPRHATAVTLPWTENFENGATGWTLSGFHNVVADAQLIEVMHPTINPNLVTLPDAGNLPTAYGGSHSLWYGESATGTFVGSDFDQTQPLLSGGTSSTPNTGWAISPDLNLIGFGNATLTFWTAWEIEGVDVPWFDMMYVEASTDGGATWGPVGSGQLNPLDDVNANANVGYSSGGVGMPPVWVQHSFSLAPYCGNTCWIRFRFDTVDQLYNGFRGWLIDDILVEGAGTFAGPTITDVTPGAGQIDDLILINGANFQSGAEVTVDGIPATSAVLSNVQAQFIVPALADGNYDVMLTNPDGLFDVCVGCFEITQVPGPTIAFIEPNWAYPGIPTPIIIQGQDFDPNAVVTIAGQLVADLVVVTSERITCVSSGTLGEGFHAVRVTNPDGQYDQCIGCFEVRVPESPSNLVISFESNDVKLNWSPAPEISPAYQIYRDTNPDGPFNIMIDEIVDTFYVDNNVLDEPESMFFYVVKTILP